MLDFFKKILNTIGMESLLKLDVESEKLTVNEALAKVEIEIERAKLAKQNLIKIIHGYGSSGTGGEIKRAVFILLNTLKKQKKITDFLPCEKFGFTHKNYKNLIKSYPYLLVDGNIKNLNPGATIVVI